MSLSKIKKSQAQANTIFYALHIVVIVLVLIAGYAAIQKIIGIKGQASLNEFEENFRAVVENLKFKSGEVRTYIVESPLEIPVKSAQFCLIDIDAAPPLDTKPTREIYNSWSSGAKENAFLLNNEDVIHSFFAGDISVADRKKNWKCFNINNGIVYDLRLESAGEKVSVSIDCSSYEGTEEKPFPEPACCADVNCDGYYFSVNLEDPGCYKDHINKIDPAPYYSHKSRFGESVKVPCCSPKELKEGSQCSQREY